MDLLRQYQAYVKWCKAIDVNPIGFVNWKKKKFKSKIKEDEYQVYITRIRKMFRENWDDWSGIL